MHLKLEFIPVPTKYKVDVGGYGISWNDEIDLSCDELWDNDVSYES